MSWVDWRFCASGREGGVLRVRVVVVVVGTEGWRWFFGGMVGGDGVEVVESGDESEDGERGRGMRARDESSCE